MKKILFVVLLCLVSFGIFANHRPIGRRIISTHIEVLDKK